MLLKEAKKILSDHKKSLLRLGVRTLSLFGSVVRNKASAGSDIDVLVDFDVLVITVGRIADEIISSQKAAEAMTV